MKIEKPGVVRKENVFKYNGEPIKMTLGTVVLTCLCVFLIVRATFTQISFTHFFIPADFMNYLNNGSNFADIKQHFFKYYKYIPQIPVILFIAGLMGRLYGIIAVMIYIVIGLFVYPVFALGGGPKYILDYNFGYILAYIPAVYFTASILKNNFSFKNILKAAFVAVLIIHLIGILYTLFIGVITKTSDTFLVGWIFAQSGAKILYDFIFSVIFMICANWVKKCLWIIMC